MKRTMFVIGVFLGYVTTALAIETTAVSQINNSASVDLSSSYIFRGKTMSKEAVLQPSLGVDLDSGLSLNVWGNLDLSDNDGVKDKNQFSEVDLVVNYVLPLPIDPVISVGAIEYLYPNVVGDESVGSDREVILTAYLEVPLNPMLSVNYGVDGAVKNSVYTELSVEQEVFSRDDLSTGVSALVGYLVPDDGQQGFTHSLFSASVAYKILTASVNYIVEMDEEVNSLEDQRTFFATIGTSTAF